MAERLLKLTDALEKMAMSKSSFYREMKANRLPKPIHVGPEQSRWRESELDAAIERFSAERDGTPHP